MANPVRIINGFRCELLIHQRKLHTIVITDKDEKKKLLEFTDNSVPEAWKLTAKYLNSISKE